MHMRYFVVKLRELGPSKFAVFFFSYFIFHAGFVVKPAVEYH